MPAKAAPTAAQSKPATIAPPANGDTSKDAASPFNQSVFNQIVTQMVEESTAPVQVPRAQAVKLPPKQAAATEDPLPELSSSLPVAPAKPAEIVSGRKQDTHGQAVSTNAKPAQPPAAVLDINIPIPVAPKLRLPSFAGEGSAEQSPMKPAAVASAEDAAVTTPQPKPMLEVKIHLDQSASEQSAPAAPSALNEEGIEQSPEDTDPGPRRTLRTAGIQEAPAASVASVNIPQQASDIGQAPLPAQNSNPFPSSPAPVQPPPLYTGETKPEPQAASAPPHEAPVEDRTKAQPPIRSLALEFTPDGAADIKVRLSERAGDVHISLHGTDPSLAGRVREGVGDLVGSLSRAGYDAEAWTPGEGRQGQRQQSDQRPSLRKTATAANTAEFNGILQQPIQEIS
jgi:hypothetical protein